VVSARISRVGIAAAPTMASATEIDITFIGAAMRMEITHHDRRGRSSDETMAALWRTNTQQWLGYQVISALTRSPVGDTVHIGYVAGSKP